MVFLMFECKTVDKYIFQMIREQIKNPDRLFYRFGKNKWGSFYNFACCFK